MVDTSIITSYIMKYAITPLFWLILILVFVFGVFVILWIKKKRRLAYPGIEIVDLGKGRIAFNNLRGGYFGKKIYAKMLWSTGKPEVMRVDTGEIVLGFSTEDFVEINGERGFVCYRDPLHQDLLVPVNKGQLRDLYPVTKFNIKNKEFVAEIAPQSYSDAVIDIINEATKETADKTEKIIQFVGWALIIIFSLVAIIFIIQYVKTSQKEAAELLLNAGKEGKAACTEICKEIINIIPSPASSGAVSIAP